MRNYEKFFTPKEVCHRLCAIADVKHDDWILEPSAGCGNICEVLHSDHPKANVWAVEINKIYELPLSSVCHKVRICDFIDFNCNIRFDKCIANPPFGNETDLNAHYIKIRNMVKVGGLIVMIVPYDFIPDVHSFTTWKLDNWATNSDGTVTPIKIISFTNH